MLTTVGIHPLAAVSVVAVDTMLFGGTVATSGVGWAASVPVGIAETSAAAGLRARALLGVMVYSFARVSAGVGMNVDDYYQPAGQALVAAATREGRQGARPAGAPQGGAVPRRLPGGRQDRGREGHAAVACADADTRARPALHEQGRRVPDDQAARHGGRTGERGELPHVPRRGDHGVPAQRRHARTRPGDRRAREPRTTPLYDRTADDITVEDIERIRI